MYGVRSFLIPFSAWVSHMLCPTVQEGHFSGELWGLATHPTNGNIFATAGDDCTVRIWSIALGVMLRKAVVDGSCRALAWSPDGR